jgi:hypothetical protein
MKRIVVAVVVVLFAAVAQAFSQDLNRLQARAQKLLDLRSTVVINKTQAAPYIEAAKRLEFLESKPLPMQDAKVVGFEFTDDPRLVYVVFKAKVVLPDIGAVPRTGREPWVWDKKDWFLRLEDLGTPFVDLNRTPAAPPARAIPFELSPKRIEFGKHTQGEVLKGVINFKSDKDEILVFRPANLPGLSFNAPVWKSKQEGEIEFELDTSLISEDVHYKPEMEVVGFEEQRTRAAFEITAQIEPRLRFVQQPSIIDPFKPVTLEIRVDNLSSTAFSFERIFMTNEAFRLVKEPPEKINPGETATIAFEYVPKEIGASQLHLELSEPVVGKHKLALPINIKLPEAVVTGYTREQLEEIIRKTRR